MKRVLIVSPHFPPTNAPDHQRVRMSLPYFRENGWEPVVLAVDAAAVAAPRDPLLAATLPADLRVQRVHAWPERLTRRIGLGNLAYRAGFQLRGAGERLLREEKFDLVYFSTTQFLVTRFGAAWLRQFRVPYVVDIQDPWRTDYYDRPDAPPAPGGWKYRFARWQAIRLEEPAWKDAAGFISVSENYLARLRDRYAWFSAKPSAVIPFGASAEDFALASSRLEIQPAFARERDQVHLVSVGAVGSIMRATIQRLFAAVRTLRDLDPTNAARLRFHFIGTSYAPAGRGVASVEPIAEEHGVRDLVSERVERVGYFVALKTLLAADAIVIPGSDDPGYNPSKIAPCFLAHKPVLALAPAGSTLEHSVRAMDFATLAPSEAEVVEFLRTLLAGLATPARSAAAVAHFESTHTARARTRQQCDLFERALHPSAR